MPEYGNIWALPQIPYHGEGMKMGDWVAQWEQWAERNMEQGYKIDDLVKYVQDQGEIFPKNLIASIKAKNTLFPGADMGYEYDLKSGQKRRFIDYHDPSKGYMDWVNMDPSELWAASSYNQWANDPKNAAFQASFGNNNYNAWLAYSRGVTSPKTVGANGVSSNPAGVAPNPSGFGSPVSNYPDSPSATYTPDDGANRTTASPILAKAQGIQAVTNQISSLASPTLAQASGFGTPQTVAPGPGTMPPRPIGAGGTVMPGPGQIPPRPQPVPRVMPWNNTTSTGRPASTPGPKLYSGFGQ